MAPALCSADAAAAAGATGGELLGFLGMLQGYLLPFLVATALGGVSAAVSYAVWWVKKKSDRTRFTTVHVPSTSKAYHWVNLFLSHQQKTVEREASLDIMIGSEEADGCKWWNMWCGQVGKEEDLSVNFRPSKDTWNRFAVEVPRDRRTVDAATSFCDKAAALSRLRDEGRVDPRQIIINPYEHTLQGGRDGAMKEFGYKIIVRNPPLWRLWEWGSTEDAVRVVRWFCDWSREGYVHREKNRTQMHVPQWGSIWRQLASRPKRPLSSIHLPDSVMSDILSDVRWFLDNRAWYERRGVPYRRGYIFYGKPGCGKSSFIFALAGHFDMPIAILDLTGSNKEGHGKISDAQLNMLVNSAPPRSILLIEEVDTLFTDKLEKKKEEDKDAAVESKDIKLGTDKMDLVTDDKKKEEDKKPEVPTQGDLDRIDAAIALLGDGPPEGGAASGGVVFCGAAAGATTGALLRLEQEAARDGCPKRLIDVLKKHGFDGEAGCFALPLDTLRQIGSEFPGALQLTLNVADTLLLRKTYGKGLAPLAKDLRELRAAVAKEREEAAEGAKPAAKEEEYKADRSYRVPSETCICSFQGLLNAIDGVSAQEGRIVVFTTNHKERLDPALIRPGRMDRQFEFRNADIEQVRTMFTRFMAGVPVRRGDGPPVEATVEEVDEASRRFATVLSDGGADGERTQFSLAQVQGYLTTQVREPDPLAAASENATAYFKLRAVAKGAEEDAPLPRQLSEEGTH